MPNLQFSVPGPVYLELVKRGETYGWSEHQVAKAMVLHALKFDVTDEDLLAIQVEATKNRADALRQRNVRPIGG